MAQSGKTYRATVELEIHLDAESLSYSDDHLASAKSIAIESAYDESVVKVLAADVRLAT